MECEALVHDSRTGMYQEHAGRLTAKGSTTPTTKLETGRADIWPHIPAPQFENLISEARRQRYVRK